MAENNDRAGTPYKVLIPAVGSETGEPHPGAWNEVEGTYTAPNDVAAIKLAEAAHGPFDHGAIGVPTRSWRPRTPTDKTEKRWRWIVPADPAGRDATAPTLDDLVREVSNRLQWNLDAYGTVWTGEDEDTRFIVGPLLDEIRRLRDV